MDGGVGERVVRLETDSAYLRRDLDRLIAGQDALRERMDARFDEMTARSEARFDAMQAQIDSRFAAADARAEATERTLQALLRHVQTLPTKADLWEWKVHWTAICVAAIAIIVGGIVGGLSALLP